MNRRQLLTTGSVAMGIVVGCLSTDDEAIGLGESHHLESVALTVDELQLAIRFESARGVTRRSQIGSMFVFLHVTSRNRGDGVADLARVEEFRLSVENDQYEPIHGAGGSVEAYADPVEGTRYEGIDRARPEIRTSGWVAFEIPIDTDVARFSWARGDPSPRYWHLQLDSSADSVPDIRPKTFTAPSSVERHESVSLEIELENRGGTAGEFKQPIVIEPTGEERLLRAELEPGETESVSVTVAQPIDNETPVDRATFVLGDRRTTVEYDVPIRDVGERYVGPDGLSVGVEFYLLPETVERELTDADGTRTYEADGGQLLMIECAVTNEDQVDRTPPSPKAFELLDEHGNSHDLSIVYPAESSVADAEFVRPITAAAYDDGELAPGETESGWILFRTETSVAIDRSRLRWERLDRRRDSDEPVGLTVEWRFSSTTE